MKVRAGILVTGTEVLTGIITDRNGPWLSEQLRSMGIEPAQITVVADRPDDITAALAAMSQMGCQLVITSGGLGPTADDLTAAVIGSFQGRPLALDSEVEAVIEAILAPLADRWPNLDHDAVMAANRKQAMVPAGATVLNPVGTAPGLIVPPREGSDGPTVVVLPGPPRELKPMWADAIETPAFKAAVVGAGSYRRSMMRLFGMPESELALTLRNIEEQEIDLDGLEITTCLRRGEIEIATTYSPDLEANYQKFAVAIEAAHGDLLFSRDETTIDQIVAQLLQGHSIALAESCTAGMLTSRLADVPGSSDYLVGGMIVYSNDAKVELAGVSPATLADHGAVSAEVASELAVGAATRLGASVGVAITGVAGPAGGTEEKPVGLVWFAVAVDGQAVFCRSVQLPGGRADIRDRSTTVAMHMIRKALQS